MKNSGKKQHGFAVFEVLFFVLLAVVITGAAYYIGTRHNKSSTEPTSSKSTTSLPVSTQKSSDALSNYENKDLGFKFSYPKSWGTPTLDSSTNDTGSSYAINFADQKDYFFSMWSKTYQPLGLGGGCLPVNPVPSYTPFEGIKDSDTFKDIKVNEPSLSIMYGGTSANGPDDGCPAVMAARKKIDNNSQIGSINFEHFTDSKFKSSDDIAKYYTNPTLFFPTDIQNEFIQVARSISNI